MDKNVEIERTMIDGRLAERHISTNAEGDKVIEIFVEEKKPLSLEKRIVQKHKQILAEEVIETVKDGVVIEKEVLSVEPPTQMKTVEHVGIAEHAKTNDGEYMTKKEVTDAIVAGISTLMEKFEVQEMSAQSEKKAFVPTAERKLAERVEEKKEDANSSSITNIVLGLLIVAQMGAIYWAFFM